MALSSKEQIRIERQMHEVCKVIDGQLRHTMAQALYFAARQYRDDAAAQPMISARIAEQFTSQADLCDLMAACLEL